MRFLVDEQLPPALARWLRARGHDADHPAETGSLGDGDGAVLRRAVESRAVIVTKDEDFAAAPDARRVQVVWIRFGNVPNRVLFERLEGSWSRVEERLAAGERLIELGW